MFAVAAHRCSEVFDPPGCVTLWRLPASVEEDFEDRWEYWLDQAGQWSEFFEQLQSINGGDLPSLLDDFGIVSSSDLESFTRLRRSAEGRAVPLPGLFSGSDRDVSLLALGFGRGAPSALAVPYARIAEE